MPPRQRISLLRDDTIMEYGVCPQMEQTAESEFKKTDALKREMSVPPDQPVSYYRNPFSNEGMKTVAVDLVSYGVGASIFGDGIKGERILTFGVVDAIRVAFFDPSFKRLMNTDATKNISDNLEDGIGLFVGSTLGLWLASMFKLGGERNLGSIVKETLATAAISTAGSFVLPSILKS